MLQAKLTVEGAGDQDKRPSDINKHSLSGNDKVFIKLYLRAGHFRCLVLVNCFKEFWNTMTKY